MTLLITTTAILVIATIVVSLGTASDLQKQRRRIAELEQAALEKEQDLEEAVGRKKTVMGSLALHTKLRDEKSQKIEDLKEELEYLKEDRVSEREIKVAGAREKSFSLNDDDGGGGESDS